MLKLTLSTIVLRVLTLSVSRADCSSDSPPLAAIHLLVSYLREFVLDQDDWFEYSYYLCSG